MPKFRWYGLCYKFMRLVFVHTYACLWWRGHETGLTQLYDSYAKSKLNKVRASRASYTFSKLHRSQKGILASTALRSCDICSNVYLDVKCQWSGLTWKWVGCRKLRLVDRIKCQLAQISAIFPECLRSDRGEIVRRCLPPLPYERRSEALQKF